MFSRTRPHFCPNCPAETNKKNKQYGPALSLVASNYSGCDVDIAECPTCKKRFVISYSVKVESIKEFK